MKKLNKKISLVSSVFTFLFLLFIMLFKSNVNVNAYDGRYDIYKFTLPDINIRMYDIDHSTQTITPYSFGAKTITLDFYVMLPLHTYYTSDGVMQEDSISYRDLEKIYLYDSFSISAFKENDFTSNYMYGLKDNMTFKELYDLVSYHDNYNSATKKSFDSYIDKTNEYVVPDVLFLWHDDMSYMVEDLDDFMELLWDVHYNYENYIVRTTEDLIVSEKQEVIEDYINENNLYTEEEYLEYGAEQLEKGKNSVDITSNDEQVIENYINENNLKTEQEYNEYGESQYELGFIEGQTSIDITSNDEEIYLRAFDEGLTTGKKIGFQEGVDSVDLEEIKKSEFDRGYALGFAEGESSVDITSDNDTVIHAYIKKYNYHTDFDFNLNFDLGYSEGIKFVYNNLPNDKVIKEYVDKYIYVNKYYTKTEYVDNSDLAYKKGYEAGLIDGKEIIYKNIKGDPIIKEYWKTKIVNGMEIKFNIEGSDKVYVIKKYDVDINDNGDFKIIIHEGQDTYTIETIENVVPGQNKQPDVVEEKDYSDLVGFFEKAGYILLIFVATILAVLFLRVILSLINRKGGNAENEKAFAV